MSVLVVLIDYRHHIPEFSASISTSTLSTVHLQPRLSGICMARNQKAVKLVFQISRLR
jgi:hypothetical protein